MAPYKHNSIKIVCFNLLIEKRQLACYVNCHFLAMKLQEWRLDTELPGMFARSRYQFTIKFKEMRLFLCA